MLVQPVQNDRHGKNTKRDKPTMHILRNDISAAFYQRFQGQK